MSAAPGREGTDPVAALQGALACEHAAVYGYAFIGARSSGRERERAADHRDAHVADRDQLHAELLRREADPVAAEVGYPLPSQTEEADLADYAADLEQRCGRAYLALVGTAEAPLRDTARRALADTAVRSLRWGREPEAFPGFPGGRPPS